MPELSQVHIDRALTNVSIAYRNEAYIADQIAVPLPVEKRSDRYFIYDRETFLRASQVAANGRPNTVRRPTAEAIEIDFTLSNSPFFCEENALSTLVPYENEQMADAPLAPRVDATEMLTDRLMLDHEIYVATKACASASYPSAHRVTLTTGGTGTSWASYTSANSLPFSNLSTAKNQVRSAIMRVPNTLMVNYRVGEILSNHPTYLDRYKYTSAETATKSGLNPVIRGLQVIEGSALKATNNEGATFASGDVWVDSGANACALVYYRGDNPGPRSMHFMRTFEAPDAATGARGFVTTSYELPIRKSTKIQVQRTTDVRGIAVNASSELLGGYLILSAIV